MAEGVIFDRSTGVRVLRATRKVEGKPVDLRGRERPRRERTSSVVWVKVTGNASGGGKYNGRIITERAASVPTLTGNVAEIDFGVIPPADDCYILNSSEVGKSTHDLTAGTPVTKMFVGIRTGHLHTDGKPFIRIAGFDWLNC